ncbi:GNAT family N-acetyltransferase [Nonomuraea sp. NPDC046570]|uniref:GNAT family N-acetyltransferase n=1 Tax=Nonomuraea sp. NPDC046570 TaxID=3155255 RepID=UPI003407B0C9
MTVYETPRLQIRPWTHAPADLDRLADIYTRPEVTRWLPPFTLEPAQIVERWQARSQGVYGVWAIHPAGEPAPVGTVLLAPLPNGDGEVEVGWHLHPAHWGHGYATEAARGALERGFASGLAEIYAVVMPGNTASQAVCARLGMSALGPMRRWYDTDLETFRISTT